MTLDSNLNLKVGLTGDIGSGKSTTLALFGGCGFLTLSADQIVHDLLRSHESTIEMVSDAFGLEVILPQGGVDRQALASLVFADTDKRLLLESILHPLVRQTWESAVIKAGDKDVIVEIPLLFEKKLEKYFNYSVTVYCNLDIKTERLKRRNLDEAAIRARLSSQMDQESKANRSDFLILNNSSLNFLQKQIQDCIAQMRARS